MKVKIKEWHAVATWRWDMPEDEVCGICRVDFDGCCPNCKYPGDDCPLNMADPAGSPYGNQEITDSENGTSEDTGESTDGDIEMQDGFIDGEALARARRAIEEAIWGPRSD
ncbi:hypothetical protein H072_2169 [Dactylellina haptotyla CBS 200.50]|uniref:Anaphase-promoting complex subunit 11 RING-H2 finger domain-containing protein n=1 Tax=Dactylellina haptotyla (strain CBS 200.50) TaxID=1284197 RepID=S8BWY0_DACHA|nr:hypothetical protein H072_2169 [Dactylellina haptotyla CBS 200.50]